ncbi:zinc finger protein 37-like [Lytechinus variegatus]|uniref:zinc finger protein 37-like n=1 Tax=Lytechinus variegatus TaxID=7654 RepID=UPI001BB1072C|nr:zinc finger protein 37-like [Lytechinus variegatus]
MSIEQTTITMYRCKMCPFTNETQEAIAVHFLKQHMYVDFCSLSESVSGDYQVCVEKFPTQEKSPSSQEQASEARAQRRRSQRKGKATACISTTLESSNSLGETDHDILAQGLDKCCKGASRATRPTRQATDKKQDESSDFESNDDRLGRGKRKKSTPKRFRTDGDQSNWTGTKLKKSVPSAYTKILQQSETNAAMRDKEVDGVGQQVQEDPSKHASINEETKLETISRTQMPIGKRVSPHLKSATDKTEPQKSANQSRSKRKRSEALTANIKAETINQKIKRLPIPFIQFKKKLDHMMNEWEIAHERQRGGLLQTCSFEGCLIKLNKEEMNMHESCHVKSMDGLRCPKCDFLCIYWRIMRKHLRNQHQVSIEKSFHCDQENCEYKFIRSNQLRKHIMDRHFKEVLVDRILKGDLDMKELEADGGQEELVPKSVRQKRKVRSDASDESLKKKRRLPQAKGDSDAIANDHRGKVTFVCDLCLSKFKDEIAMETHKKGHETDQEGMLICSDCEIPFESTDALKDHYRKEHKRKLMRHQCQQCSFATDKVYQMNAHQAIHTGEKGVMCDQCGKWLANQYNLRVHEYRKHSTEEQMTVTCSECPYKCADKSILRDHIKQHHKWMLKNPIYHKCPHCDYVGHKKQSLEFHMRIHTEQRRFKCHLCPYASKTKNHLKIHMQTHDGYQSASCPDCDFKAASKKRLSEHIMRRHLEVEPYVCKICGWRTAYSGNMWKHINQHKIKLGNDMPDEPVTVELELLKGTVLPVMPKAPTGKTRGQTGVENGLLVDLVLNNPQNDSVDICEEELTAEQDVGTSPGSEQIQVLQFSGDNAQSTFLGGCDEGIQIVQIGEDALGVTPELGEQVVAHIRHGDSTQIPHESSQMEIFITHDGNGDRPDDAVEVLHVKEDGSIVSSTINRDVEVAVLALAQLEPGTQAMELPAAGGDGGGRITILQTVQKNQETVGTSDPTESGDQGSIPDKLSTDNSISPATTTPPPISLRI